VLSRATQAQDDTGLTAGLNEDQLVVQSAKSAKRAAAQKEFLAWLTDVEVEEWASELQEQGFDTLRKVRDGLRYWEK
jgi:hypothetical protein